MNTPPYLELNFQENGGLYQFDSIEQIRKFLSDEIKFWDWLNSIQNQTYRPIIGRLYSEIHNNLASTLNHLNNRNNYSTDTDFASTIKERLSHCFITKKIPISTSPLGEFINHQKDENLMQIAAGLCVYLDIENVLNGRDRYIFLEGANLIANFRMGLHPNTSAAYRTTITKAKNDLVAKVFEKMQQADDFLKGIEKENKEELDKFISEKIQEIEEQKTIHINDYNNIMPRAINSIAELEQTKKTYEEFMRLKAPVKYWSIKKRHHRHYSVGYGVVALAIVLAGIFLLQNTLSHASSMALNISNDIADIHVDASSEKIVQTKTTGEIAFDGLHYIYYPIFISSLLIILSLYFWILRLFVRLTLSEHHLSIDAHEKSIMTSTYLALSHKKLLDEKDRSLILTSLFRPTSDGFVKDDSSPDIMLSAMLSKYLSK